jgi:outer membrane protein assembly factor BamA
MSYTSKYYLFPVLLLCFITQLSVIAQEEADSTKAYDMDLNAYPYAFYTPETQLAIGAGGILTFYTKKESKLNPSKVTFSGFYSTVKTYELFLVSEIYFLRNKMATKIDLRYSHKVDRFFGIGNDTPDLGNEEYVLDNTGGTIDFQIPPFLMLTTRSGLIYEYRNYKIVDTKENPYLTDTNIPGINGGAVSGLGLVWVWDNRDNVFFPNSGAYTELKSIFYTKDLGSDYTYNWFEFNARRYWAFHPDHVLAVQMYYSRTDGIPPFYKLPALGGSSIMRGYFEGRYRDANYLAVQTEYRQYFWGRFGFVAFIGFGDVSRQVTSFELRHLKTSYGAGLRFLFNKEQKINLRADIGLGPGTSGVYFGIEEAF